MGYEVDILVAGPVNNCKESETGKIITLRTPFFGSKLLFISKYLYALKVKKTVSLMVKKYDVLHFHGDNGFISSKFAAKSILTLHGIANDNSSIFKKIVTFPSSRIERNNVMKARIVFSMSKDAAEFFARFSKTQINIIKQPVDTDFYRALPKEEILSVKKKLGFPDESMHNLIIGLIVGTDPIRKGLYTAIRAIGEIRDTAIILVGIGFPSLAIESTSYKHVGKVDEKIKLEYLQIADFFIFPSRKDYFPISVLEAASVGLPLIVSKICGVSELKAIVPYLDEIDSMEPKLYQAAVERFIEYHKGRESIHYVQERNLLEQHSISAVLKVYCEAYKTLLSND